MKMKKITIIVQDNMDIALLLTGINWIRKNNLESTRRYLSLPDEFKKDKILDELVDDFDKLNMLGAQLSKIIKGKE